MKKLLCFVLTPAVLLAGGFLAVSRSQEKDAKDGEEKAIGQFAEALVAAFDKRDPAGLAALWSEDGEYISSITGERMRGRKAIEADYAARLKKAKGAKGVQLRLALDAIRFISPEVAVVDGTSTFIKGDQSPDDSTFTMILVKKDGRWLLDSVRKTDLPGPDSHYDELKELEWLVGEWEYKDGDVEVRSQADWAGHKNFLTRRYTLLTNGEVQDEGTQVIGWDPAQQTIRSWVFGGDGTFGEGVWTRDGNRWSAKATGILPDGKKSAGTQITAKIDNDHYTFQVISRSVGGQLLPNTEVINLTRKSGKTEGKE